MTKMKSVSQVLSDILAHYDLGQLVEHKKDERGFVNTSFVIDVEKDAQRFRYFLRIYKTGIKQKEIEFEHSLLDHLKLNSSLPVARVYRTLDGRSYLFQKTAQDDEPRYIAIFEFLPGEDKYTWIGPHCTDKEIINSAIVLAKFHETVSDFHPKGERVESGIVQLLPEILDTLKTCPGKSKGSIFDDCLLKNFGLMKSAMENAIYALRESVRRDLTRVVIHCDYHPGNLKFIDNEVTALFDFDWSKLDIRIFDVALAIFYFFTEWEGKLDGSLRLHEVEIFLSAYQQTLQNSNKLKPLNAQECGLLATMIAASNIYVLNWTILDFYSKDISAQDYLVFLEHGINLIKWLEVEENQARLADVIHKISLP